MTHLSRLHVPCTEASWHYWMFFVCYLVVFASKYTGSCRFVVTICSHPSFWFVPGLWWLYVFSLLLWPCYLGRCVLWLCVVCPVCVVVQRWTTDGLRAGSATWFTYNLLKGVIEVYSSLALTSLFKFFIRSFDVQCVFQNHNVLTVSYKLHSFTASPVFYVLRL